MCTNIRRPVCVVSWDPNLPSLSAMQQKHWRSMTTSDPYLAEVFPDPHLIIYKKQTNIKDFLIRASLQNSCSEKQKKTGWNEKVW